jgi:MGT family glycosyltransferase
VRVLQVIWDGGGNVEPQLAITRALLARGHEVAVLGNRCQRLRVESVGAEFAAYRHAPDNDSSSAETDILRDWEARTPMGAFARLRDRVMYGPAAAFARDVLEQAAERSPDVICWDYLLAGAGVAAESAGLPSAAAVHTVYPLPADGVPPFGLGLPPARGPLGRTRDRLLARVFDQAFRPGLKAINQARDDLGLMRQSGPFDHVTRADRIIVMTTPALDFAGPRTVPANVRFVGPALAARAGSTEPCETDDRPLVLASFSTTYMNQLDLIKRVLRAFADLPVRGLLTTGPAVDVGVLEPPDNVVVRDFVPHAAVLPAAAAVVTHAGMGTVHAALAAGVPLVCVPQGRDQNDVAARVVYRGAGLRLSARAGPGRIGEAIREVVSTGSYRAAAARIGAEMGPGDGGERAAEELETLAV